VGTHEDPLAAFAAQFPFPALVMAGGKEAQAVLVQLPVVDQAELVQEAEREPAKPLLQRGVQLVPERAPAAQLPAPALVMLGRPAQTGGMYTHAGTGAKQLLT